MTLADGADPDGTARTTQDTTCQPSTTYYYRICASNDGGTSAWAYANADTNGNPGPVTTLAPPAPAAPSGLTAAGVSSSEIDLSWTDADAKTKRQAKLERGSLLRAEAHRASALNLVSA